jgi:ribosomal-protein-alanine N-acetyltransferase
MKSIPIQTILQTERLQLRGVSHSDIDLVWSASRTPGFNDGMVWDPPKSKEELVPIIKKNLVAWEQGESFTFTIELSEANIPIGRVAIRREDDQGVWDIGFWIHPDYWNNGYATEAARVVIQFGFVELAASIITTAHAIFNTQSKRVIEKLGFRFTGENPCGFMKQGKPVAEYEYAIDKKSL